MFRLVGEAGVKLVSATKCAEEKAFGKKRLPFPKLIGQPYEVKLVTFSVVAKKAN